MFLRTIRYDLTPLSHPTETPTLQQFTCSTIGACFGTDTRAGRFFFLRENLVMTRAIRILLHEKTSKIVSTRFKISAVSRVTQVHTYTQTYYVQKFISIVTYASMRLLQVFN